MITIKNKKLPYEERVTLTPTKARALIANLTDKDVTHHKTTHRQRNESPSNTEALRLVMTNGGWLPIDTWPEGSTAFIRASDNIIVQARHRISAIAGITNENFELPWILRYVSDEDADAVLRAQLNGKPKWTPADYIGAQYGVLRNARFAATLRAILWMDNGSYGDTLSTEDIDNILMPKYQKSVAWAIEALNAKRGSCVPATVVGVFAWCHRRASSKAMEVLKSDAEKIATGLEMKQGDPAYIIEREFVTKRSKSESNHKRRTTVSTHQVDRWDEVLFTARLIEMSVLGEQATRRPSMNKDTAVALFKRLETLLKKRVNA